MNIYFESSAVLRDLLDGEHAEAIRSEVAKASLVVTSRLTLAEIARVLARVRATKSEVASLLAPREASFLAETELWGIHPVSEEILARCGRPFPLEPVRMLDAIHLATIERLSGELEKLVVVSTDDRVRNNAKELGFRTSP